MGLLERFFGRTRKDVLSEMIVVLEQQVKPEVERLILGIDGPNQAIADGTWRTVESIMLAKMVGHELMPPPIVPPSVRRPQRLGDMQVVG